MKAEWRTERLGEVCSFLNRGSSPKYLEEGGICVLGQRCVRNHRVYYEYSRRHDDQAKAVAAGRFVEAGDVLVNSTGVGSLGRVAQVRDAPAEPTTVDSHVTIVRPGPGTFFPDFFGYMMMTIEDAITEAGEGCGGQTELGRRVLAERFSVRYPTSFEEQQRIVGILDEAFEGIAAARENAERNLRNARALLASQLRSVFTQNGGGWSETALGDVCAFVRGPFGGSLKKSTFVADGYAVYEQQHAIYDQFDSVRYFVNADKFEAMKRFELLPGDLIMSCSGTMGRVALVPGGVKPGIINQALLKLTPSDAISGSFLKAWMDSEVFGEALQEFSGGAAMQNVASVKVLKQIRVPLPGIEEQGRIVEELDVLRSEIRRLESIYERNLAALDELKASLLHQAFSGDL